jgi:prophage tail gpP-like protein
VIDEVLSYSATADMLALADDAAFEFPVSPAIWRAVQPDNDFTLWIDDSPVITGILDSRRKSAEGIFVAGRDLGGRIVDERAPLKSFGGGASIVSLFGELVGDWFPSVTLVNARNRAVIGGRGRRRNTALAEPVFTRGDRDLRKEVDAGERIGEVVTHLAEQAGLLVWSTGDGREFFVGLVNQEQAASWRFIAAPAGSARHRQSNVRDMVIDDDLSEYFSEITVTGASKGEKTRRLAIVTDGDGEHGVGNLFARPKRHLISDHDVKSPAEALERANRERAELGAGVRTVEIIAGGHGQVTTSGNVPEIFHFDSVARCEDDEIGEQLDAYITRCVYEGARDDDQTTLSAVPVGTLLRVNG